MMKPATSRPVSQIRDDPLAFEVKPEVGLINENVEFELGMPLNQVIIMLQQNSRLISDVKFSYAKKRPFSRHISLHLQKDGIKLHFDQHSQLLVHIDVDDLGAVILKYNDRVFSEPENEAVLDRVDEFFGSTHPGAYDERQKLYVQSWRGISFCFPNTGNVQVAPGPGFTPGLSSLKYAENTELRLTKMSIFKGTAPNKNEPVEMPLSSYCGQNRTKKVSAKFEDGRLNGVEITFWTQRPVVDRSTEEDFELVELIRSIQFGDDVWTVQRALGAPSKIYYKSEDKMSIHKGTVERQFREVANVPHFFFNYFSMGLDILFDFYSKRVIKFVLHTNIPGHYDFGIYARCPFEIVVDGQDKDRIMIHTESKYEDMITVFNDPASDQPRAPVISRRREGTDPFGSTFLYGTNQLIVEIMDNQHISAVTFYADNL